MTLRSRIIAAILGLLLVAPAGSVLAADSSIAPMSAAKVKGVFNPADWADDVARIRAESAARHGLNPSLDARMAIEPRTVRLQDLEFPSSRTIADPAKLAKHGPFDMAKYDPITVDRTSSGRLIIMNGVTRVTNAMRAGIKELPAYVFNR